MIRINARHALLSLVFLLLFAAAGGAPAAAEQRVALVIGNAAYTFAALKNPVNDASDIAGALQRLGFTVILKKNAGLREMEEALGDFGTRLKQGGVGLFYYAGHGLQVAGVNYLVPVGARIDKESDIKYEALDAGRVLDEMANANNGLNIVILDACRDNPFSRRFRSMNRGLAVLGSAPAGTFISYSTGPGQVALDGDGRNSPYAAAFLKSIQEPGLTIEQVFKNVRHHLGRETGGRQVPWELSSLEGDFYFTPAKAAPGGRTRDLAAAEDAGNEAPAAPPAGEARTFTDPVTGMEFVLVRGGCFRMGDTFGDGLPSEKPVHEVCLNGFYIGKYEVTQAQWRKVMGKNPSHFKDCGDNCPVESVSWTDVQSFIAELNGMGSRKYRLPTEAEWEYAARDGGKAEKWAGTSSDDKLADYAWYDANSGDRSHPAGKKKPNALGLYDMSGNVWEWTQDWFGESYYPSSPRDNPRGPDEGTARVLRGGCWLDRAQDCRTTIRYSFPPGTGFKSIGFRLIRQ